MKTKASYQVVTKTGSRELAEFLRKNGRLLLPMLELITDSRMAIDELIDVTGRATIEAVLLLSAQEAAGPPHPGKGGGAIRRHGRQKGVACLAERKLRVDKPRLRHKDGGKGAEVEIPAYEAIHNDALLGKRMLDILMRGVSTRNYAKVLPEMAETVGVSKSSVSREFIEAGEELLKDLLQRDFSEKDILIVYH